MNEPHVAQDKPEFIMQEPATALERMHIEEYLRGKGHTLLSLQTLPEEEARQLRIEASVYASTRLAEVEMRSQMMQDIHGGAPTSE